MPLGKRFGWARRVSSGQNVARRAAPEANCHFFAQSTIAIRPAGSRPAGFYPPKLYIQCLRPNCHPAEPVVRSHLAPPERHVMRPLPLPAPSGNPSGRGFSLTGRDQYCSLWRDMQVVASDRWRVQRRLPGVHPPHAVITTACGAFHFTTRSPCMGVSPRRATAKSCCAFANF